MKKLSVFTIGLALAVTVSAFSGCTGKGTEDVSLQTSAGTVSEGTTTQEADPYDKLPLEISVAILDRGQVPPAKGTYEDNDVAKWINENAPVTVKFVPIPRWETTQKYNIMLAAGEAPDIFMEFQPEMVQDYVNNGSLLELGALIDKYGPNIRELTPPEVKKWGVYNGKEYAVPQIRSEISVANWIIWVRQDWLDKLGLTMPATTDEFYEVAKAFRENDPDGNNKKDTYGFSLAWGADGWIADLFGAMPSTWIPGADGTFGHASVSDNMRDAAAFMKRLYDGDLIDKEFFTDKTGSKTQQDFVTNKLGLYAAGTNYVNNFWGTLKKNVPDARVAPVPAPLSPNGQFGYYQEREVSFLNMVPATCKNPKAVVLYLDWMISKGWETVKYGEEGKHYRKEGSIVIPTYDNDTWKNDLIYRAEYAILTNENIKAADLEKLYASADETTREAKAIEAKAIDATFKVPYKRYTPTNNLGLQVVTEKMPNMITFANETWLKCIIGGKDMSPDQALQLIREEWDRLGYQEVKKQFNEAAKNLN